MSTKRQAGSFFQIDRAAMPSIRKLSRPASIVVFLELCSMADAKGICWPSIHHLSDKSGLGRSSIKRALHDLAEAGLIDVTSGKGCKVTSTYRLLRMGPDQDLLNGASSEPITQLNGSSSEPRMGPDQDANGSSSEPLNGSRGGPLNENHSLNENHERKPLNEKRAADAGLFPPELDTSEFRQAWGKWELYRKSKKKPISAMAREAQLKQLAEHGSAVAVAAIKKAIASDWQGLFPESNSKKPSQGIDRVGPGMRYDPDAAKKGITCGDI